MNEVTPKECSEKSRNVTAVSGMSPRVRGMVPIIFGKWLPFMVSGYSDWKVPESFGRVQKFSGLPKKSRMVGMTSGTHVASGPHGPTRAGRILEGREES